MKRMLLPLIVALSIGAAPAARADGQAAPVRIDVDLACADGGGADLTPPRASR